MCLDQIDIVKKGRSSKIEWGWKIFKWNPHWDHPLRFWIMSNKGSFNVFQRKWLTSIQRTVSVAGFDGIRASEYQSGFHIYENRKDIAHIYFTGRMVRVKYKGVLIRGSQYGRDVVVAKHMWVPQQRRKSNGK